METIGKQITGWRNAGRKTPESPRHRPVRPAEQELGPLLFPHIRHTLRALRDCGHEQEEMLRAILNDARLPPRSRGLAGRDAGAGAMLLNRRGGVVLANKQAQTFLATGELLSKSDRGLSAPASRDTAHMRDMILQAARAAEGGVYAPPETLLLRGTRRTDFPFRMSVAPFLAHGRERRGPVSQARVLVTLSRFAVE